MPEIPERRGQACTAPQQHEVEEASIARAQKREDPMHRQATKQRQEVFRQ
jgi:hypothetical protein